MLLRKLIIVLIAISISSCFTGKGTSLDCTPTCYYFSPKMAEAKRKETKPIFMYIDGREYTVGLEGENKIELLRATFPDIELIKCGCREFFNIKTISNDF